LELIIVNDGSTDSSQKIITHYQNLDSRIILINQKNSGKPSIARNKGIKKATGKIICFLDSDDFFYPNKVQRIIDAFNLNQSVDYVFHDHSYTNENLIVTSVSHVHKSISSSGFSLLMQEISPNIYKPIQSLFKSFLFNKPLIWTGSIAIRKKSYIENNLLFNEQLTCAEDILLWCYIVSNGNGLYIDEVLSLYRNNMESMTKDIAQVDYDTFKFYKLILKNHFNDLSSIEQKTLKDRAVSDILSAAYIKEINGEKKLSYQMLLESMKFSLSLRTLIAFIKFFARQMIKGN